VGAFDVALRSPRRAVRQALGAALTSPPARVQRLLGVRGPLLERAMASSRLVVAGRAPVMPAWQRYSGVVWTHLDPFTLSEAERVRVIVPSGLYGVTTGEDPVADYRLKMNVSLSPLGSLAAFWRPRLTDALKGHVAGAVVVNLLPKEHAASIDEPALRTFCELVTVRFEDAGGAAVGHAAKAIKGALARELLTGGVDALRTFGSDHWRVAARDDGFVVETR
jgi:cytoplasmic iron level regulating protein YaaA (DUF328/UPF0246 family)